MLSCLQLSQHTQRNHQHFGNHTDIGKRRRPTPSVQSSSGIRMFEVIDNWCHLVPSCHIPSGAVVLHSSNPHNTAEPESQEVWRVRAARACAIAKNTPRERGKNGTRKASVRGQVLRRPGKQDTQKAAAKKKLTLGMQRAATSKHKPSDAWRAWACQRRGAGHAKRQIRYSRCKRSCRVVPIGGP